MLHNFIIEQKGYQSQVKQGSSILTLTMFDLYRLIQG